MMPLQRKSTLTDLESLAPKERVDDEVVIHDRLRSCHFCGSHIQSSGEIYMLDDAVYCCASHRARAAVGDTRADAAVLGGHARPERASTSTGVGLAASHRSWFSLHELDRSNSSSSTSSEGSTTASPQRQRRARDSSSRRSPLASIFN
mmetsp:Transcript_15785/g.42439  ORF Transcript_15785/g.42439 Transcript_15785/m.42439 type:complete len:148 (+) Transcript_15785:51-494(+)